MYAAMTPAGVGGAGRTTQGITSPLPLNGSLRGPAARLSSS